MSIAEFQRAFADLIASPERCVARREGGGTVATVTVSASVSPPATQGSASRGRYTAWP